MSRTQTNPFCLVLFVLLTAPFSGFAGTPSTGWKATEPGTYSLSDPSNWVGGNVNGIFSEELELSGDQVIVVDSDSTFANGLYVAAGGDGRITFSSTGTRILSVAGSGLTALSKVWVDVSGGTLTLSGLIRDGEGRLNPSVVEKLGAGMLVTDSPMEAAGDVLTVANGSWTFGGAISGTDFVVEGGTDGNALVLFSSSANTFTGDVSIDGQGKPLVVEFCVAGAVPAEATIGVFGTGVLRGNNAAGYPCSFFTANGKIHPTSDGSLAFGSSYEPGNIDLTECPALAIGGHGNRYQYGGSILVKDGETLIIRSANHLEFTSANMLSGTFDVRIESPGSTIYLQTLQPFMGKLIVDGSGLCLRDQGANQASLPNADVELRNNANLFIQSSKGAGTTRMKSLTMKRSTMNVSGNSSNDVADRITDAICIDGECGGASFIKFSSGTKALTLTADRLEMPLPGILAVEGVGLGAEPGASACNLFFMNPPSCVGDGGAAGSATMSILPRVIGGDTANGAEENSLNKQSFVTYESDRGMRPLNLTTEYATVPATDGSKVNLKIPFGAPLTLTSSASVNSILFQGGANNSWANEMLIAQDETCGISVGSGMILCGQRAAGNALYTGAPIDFGTATGVILYGSKTATVMSSDLSGTNGLVLGQLQTVTPSGNKLMRFFGPSQWHLSGDVYILSNCRLASNYVPNSTCSGDLYVMGAALLWHPTMMVNGLYGSGELRPEGNAGKVTLTVGTDGANGDFCGEFVDSANYSLVKLGEGVQRFSSESMALSNLTVSAGTVRIDGVLNATLTSIEDNGTLSGCGNVASRVEALEGAALAAGSPEMGAGHPELFVDGDLAFKGATTLYCTMFAENIFSRVTVSGDVTVADDAKVSVALSDAQTPGTHVVLTAGNTLTQTDFTRGENCQKLALSSDRHSLLIQRRDGSMIFVR